MKGSFNLEIINTKNTLSNNQQAYFRDRLKPLLKKEGIISICLDDSSLFIEYNPDVLDRALITDLLLENNISISEPLAKSKLDIIVR